MRKAQTKLDVVRELMHEMERKQFESNQVPTAQLQTKPHKNQSSYDGIWNRNC